MTRRAHVITWLLVVLALLGGGCGDRDVPSCLGRLEPVTKPLPMSWVRSTQSQTIGINDDGAKRSIRRNPKRIVSALPGITEMVDFLGCRDRLVAVTMYCDTPHDVTSLPKISVNPLSTEQLRALRPDLILVDAALHRADMGALETLASESRMEVLPLRTSRTLGDLDSSMMLLATVLDTPEAVELAQAWRTRRKRLEHELRARVASVPVRMMAVGQWEPLYVLHPGSLIDDMMHMVGGVNIACDATATASGTFSEELVLARGPRVILASQMPMPPKLQKRWSRVPAIKHDAIIDISGDAYARGGPRTLDALTSLAERVMDVANAREREPK